MPLSAAAALRAAVHEALTADAALAALLGGPKIYDEPPHPAECPYVTLGEARVSDFSTGTEQAAEHALTLRRLPSGCHHQRFRARRSDDAVAAATLALVPRTRCGPQ